VAATPLKFGLRHPPCRPVTEMAAFAVEAEDAGFDVAWFPDSQFLWRNVWSTLALAATKTRTIGLGAAVTNFETRHVAVTAAAASTIEELAPHRFRIGFGTGDSAVKTLGLRPTTLARMRENIGIFRRLTGGEPVVFGTEGDFAHREMLLAAAPGYQLPVYMAASGPKALALAGELCDGIIILAGVNPDLIRRSLSHVEEGAKRGGRTLDDIDLWLAAHTFVTPDWETAARMVKPLCITSAQLGASAALRSVGIEIEVPKVVPGIYPDVTHAAKWDVAISGSDQYVSQEMADIYARNFTFAGTAKDVIGRIETAAELGIRSFYIQAPLSYELPRTQLEAFRDNIIPHFHAA
jgi:5,10-methylenetetrahydromethanopterin reductase